MTQLLFIIGVQKSGTSLLNRMLMAQSCVTNPFLPEGKMFWGDEPPFTPELKPCGELFQKHHGLKGHALDKNDYQPEDQTLLLKRIEQAAVKTPILMNKNPYNSVRIDWIKRVFPDCRIVSMVRDPVANAFSLLKKYIDHPNRGVEPDNGWWGIKPKHWQQFLQDDKLLQSAHQWQAVNQHIWQQKHAVDLTIRYDSLCDDPNTHIQSILKLCGHDLVADKPFDRLENLDDEYTRGSRLLSKNREFRKNQDFNLNDLKEKMELPALTSSQIDRVRDITQNLWLKFN